MTSRLSWLQRALLSLIERVTHKYDREFFVGDIQEAFGDESQEHSPRTLWLLRQLVSASVLRMTPGVNREAERRDAKTSRSRRESPLATWLHDLRQAARSIKRRPFSSLMISLTLGVGIGLTTVVYMFADAVLFRPLAFDEPDRVAVIDIKTRSESWHGTSEPGLLDLQKLNEFEHVAGWSARSFTVLQEPESIRLNSVQSTSNLLQAVGVAPAIGRYFDAQEDRPDGARVVVISNRLWHSMFGGSPGVTNETLELDGERFQIIGVLPAGFRYPDPRFDLYTPLRIDPNEPWGRTNHYLNVIARLRDGVSLQTAQTAVTTLGQQTETGYPEVYGDWGHTARARSAQEALLGGFKTPVLLVIGAVLALLLLTCANVANLQLWRAAARGREFTIRKTLGALNSRLTSQLMTESFLLASCGALLGVAIAWVARRVVPVLLPERLPRVDEMQFDPRVLLVVLALTVFVTVASGLLPSLRSARKRASLSVREQGGSVAAALTRRLLVTAQVALAMLLLLGCGLMVRSLQELTRVEIGFDPQDVLTFDVALPEGRYDTAEKAALYFEQADRTLNQLPSVAVAGSVAHLPLSSGFNQWTIEVEGQPPANVAQAPAAVPQHLTPGVFDALRFQVLKGRGLLETDRADSEKVVVINQTMARELWPDQDPLGKRFRVYQEDGVWMTIVGVIRDVRFERVELEARPRWYVPYSQSEITAYYAPTNMSFTVRASDSASVSSKAMTDTVLAALRELDPTVPILEVAAYPTLVREALGRPRQITTWLALFAAVALLLAVLGLYGVLSNSVSARRRELSVRMALGATPREILGRVVSEGLLLFAAGWAAGLGLALLVSRTVASLLYGVAPSDARALFYVTLTLLLVALAASYLPALRASRVDPATMLRSD